MVDTAAHGAPRVATGCNMTTNAGAGTGAETSGARTTVPVADALRFWCKLGFISFGGPAGQIAIMHTELVERRRWISEKRFLHALNYCMVLPGPEAQQLATYLGWLMHRTWGGIAAGVLFVLPSLLILVGLAWAYVSFSDLPLMNAALYGIKPAVAAIVLHAAWRIGSRALRNAWHWSIAVGAFVAMLALRMPFPVIILGAAVLGVLHGRMSRNGGELAVAHVSGSGIGAAALIDDDTPLPPHTRFRRMRFLAVVAAGLLLWTVPMAALATGLGWQHLLTQMSWFFTKAALLTFGGAYAVLPYVTQAAVVDYGWVTATQMMDALALGETTPGPLIMLVSFVGFVGAYAQVPLGPELPLLAGLVAALLVAWFTFLPSFIFILAGGPFVESTRGDVKFAAPLSAITAAVVGGIVQLGLFFGYHVLWPTGLTGSLDVTALAMTAAAVLALFRFEWSIVQVVLAAALLGAIVGYLR
jgi:chromate transporter